MEKIRKFGLLIALLAVLSACGQQQTPPPEPESEPVETILPEPEPVETILPEPEPVEAVLPEPEAAAVLEPPPELDPGDAVTVNGTDLAGGSVWIENVLCVKLEELAQALDCMWLWNEKTGKGGFLWNNKWVALRDYAPGFQFDDQWGTLPISPVMVDGAVYVPVTELCAGLGMGVFDDAEQEHLYITPASGTWAIPEGHRVPVLMYHGVTDDVWGSTELFVRPADMEAQLQYLVENGFTPIWFEDLARVDQIEKPVILTFDDGYADNYEELFPLLKKYQVKATVFVITGAMDWNPRSLTSEQIRELSDSGLVSIQSHTATHPYLSYLTREQQEQELAQSKLALLRITGKEPYVICYPSGSYNQDTLDLAPMYYRMGIDMNGGDYHTGDDPYQVSRWYVSRYNSLFTFIDMVE